VCPQTTGWAAAAVPVVEHFRGRADQLFSAGHVCGPISPSTETPAQAWKARTRPSVVGPNEPSAAIGVYRLGFSARFSSH
jgi:hypothetical protein